jgi:hypothetical protein
MVVPPIERPRWRFLTKTPTRYTSKWSFALRSVKGDAAQHTCITVRCTWLLNTRLVRHARENRCDYESGGSISLKYEAHCWAPHRERFIRILTSIADHWLSAQPIMTFDNAPIFNQ